VYKRNKWEKEEIEILVENYKNGLEYVLVLLPKHTKNSIKKKAKLLNLKVSFIIVEELKQAVIESNSISDVYRKMNKSKSGDSYKIIKRIIEENDIDISHFNPYSRNHLNIKNKKIPIKDYLVVGSKIGSNSLKYKLYDQNLKSRICEMCSQDENWNGEKISLILDHINGISNDNRLENLRILCPNCNATLETHYLKYKRYNEKLENLKNELKTKNNIQIERNENKNFTISEKNSQLSQRKVERPSYKNLLSEVKDIGYVKTGKIYNVSDNCIRKWIKMYEKYGENF